MNDCDLSASDNRCRIENFSSVYYENRFKQNIKRIKHDFLITIEFYLNCVVLRIELCTIFVSIFDISLITSSLLTIKNVISAL